MSLVEKQKMCGVPSSSKYVPVVKNVPKHSVSDPDSLNPDPDPAKNLNPDPGKFVTPTKNFMNFFRCRVLHHQPNQGCLKALLGVRHNDLLGGKDLGHQLVSTCPLLFTSTLYH